MRRAELVLRGHERGHSNRFEVVPRIAVFLAAVLARPASLRVADVDLN